MRVFLSWSGERSKQVAELLKYWLKCVIQDSEPWMSTQDISRGELWYPAINNQIAEITTGIICLTKENKEKPWILFESGTLAKGLTTSRLITFLIDLENTDMITSPLSGFNHTEPTEDGLFKLASSVNSLTNKPLDEFILKDVFEKYWGTFKNKFDEIIKETEPKTDSSKKASKPDPNGELLKELVLSVRNLERKINNINPTSQAEKSINNSRKFTIKSEKPLFQNFTDTEDMLQILTDKFRKSSENGDVDFETT